MLYTDYALSIHYVTNIPIRRAVVLLWYNYQHMNVILRSSIALNPPVWLTPSGIYDIEGTNEICTQSAEMGLAVSGAQPLFTLGLLLLALSLVDFLS